MYISYVYVILILSNCYQLYIRLILILKHTNFIQVLIWLAKNNITMKQSSIALKEPKQSLLHFYIPTSVYDTATKEKIQKHLTDINDVITEEDIRKIDTTHTLKNNDISPNA